MSRRNWMCPQLRVLNRITRYTTYLSASRYAKDAVPTKLVRRYVGVEQDELPSSVGLVFLSSIRQRSDRARSSNIAQDSSGLRSRSLPPADWSMKKILHDVVGTSGYHYGVLRSFPVERIEQGIG
ncbi:hypothetical protein Tco_1215205 [Tanacetum coccineum]